MGIRVTEDNGQKYFGSPTAGQTTIIAGACSLKWQNGFYAVLRLLHKDLDYSYGPINMSMKPLLALTQILPRMVLLCFLHFSKVSHLNKPLA